MSEHHEPSLADAIALAASAHARAGQCERNGQPYVLHPIRVMLQLESETDRIVAVLHDTVEDTDVSLEQVRRLGFGEAVVAALDAVTRRDGEDYFDFIARAAADPVARRVKLADLADNLDLSRIPEPTDADRRRMDKYERARAMLLDAADREAPAMASHDELSELEGLVAREEEEDADALARARSEAERLGKEPFDLDAFEALYDTASDLSPGGAHAEPREERERNWAYRYYVEAPEVRTIAEFADRQKRLDPWR